MLTKTILTSALISTVSAHQVFQQLWINEVTPGPKVGIRMPPNNSPVKDIKSNDMACNVPVAGAAAVETIEAKAGDSVKVQWSPAVHPGPITHFLKRVDNAATDTGVGAGWFKIDELDTVNGKWASEVMKENDMMHNFKLPTGLSSGEYLLRSEMFGLHNSQILDGSEIFMGCAQLKVTGSGSGTCGPTIEIPGAYKADDKNIFIPNFYEKSKFDMSTYKAPGGEIASCGGSDGGAAPTVPSTPQPATSTVAGAPSPVASPSAIVEATPKAAPKESVDGGEAPASSPIAPSVSAPASAPAAGNDASAGDLPTTSSLDSFMTWLKEKTESTLDTFKTWLQGQETGSKARRHARAF